MPIVRNGDSVHVEYDIPEDIKSRIPDCFYIAMVGELVSIFGINIFQKIEYAEYDDNGEEIEASYYDLNSGTGGWHEAFKMTCRKLDMLWLIEYCRSLEWYDRDIFDGEIEGEIIKRCCEKDFGEDHANCYYKYLCSID